MKRISFAFIAIIATALVLHYGAAAIVDHFGDCAKSCHWNDSTGSYDCPPLEPHLDVRMTREPIGGKPVYWYRASVKNSTCQSVRLDADFFSENKDYGAEIRIKQTRLELRDASGKLLAPNEPMAAGGILEVESELHPYIYDTSELKDELESKTVSNQGNYALQAVVIPPGATIAASPTKLAPYRIELRTVETKDYVGTGIFKTPVRSVNPEKTYAAPPGGFRRLVEYDLSSPGRYTARFVIDEAAHFDFSGTTKGRRLVEILRWLAKPRLFAPSKRRVPIKAQSDAVEIEVER